MTAGCAQQSRNRAVLIETTTRRQMRADLFTSYLVGLRQVFGLAFGDKEAEELKKNNEVTFSHDAFGSPAETTIRVSGRTENEEDPAFVMAVPDCRH